MADEKISALTEKVTVVANDEFIIVDSVTALNRRIKAALLVIKVGTPIDNEIGLWTGDGTIKGHVGLTYNDTTFKIGGDTTAIHLNISGTFLLKNSSGTNIFVIDDNGTTGRFRVFDDTQGFEVHIEPDNATADIQTPGCQHGIILPKGTDAERPASPSEGLIRYNTDRDRIEYYNLTDATYRDLLETSDITAAISVKLTLNQAQMQAINTSPVEIVADPGAGKVIEIISCTIKNKFNTTAFASASVLDLTFTAGEPMWSSLTGFITAVATKYQPMFSIANNDSKVSTSLKVTSASDATLGNAASVIEVYLNYRIVDTN